MYRILNLPQALGGVSLPILAGRLASIRKLRPFLPYLPSYIAAEAFLPVDGFDMLSQIVLALGQQLHMHLA
jgi:hypothetical protein